MTMLWQCIYRRKPATLSGANELINRYIHFYNHERIQLKTGEAPLTLRLSAYNSIPESLFMLSALSGAVHCCPRALLCQCRLRPR